MDKIIPDSSVMVKWLNKDKEGYLEQSSKVIEEALDGKTELLAPELARYEIGNVLLKTKKLTPQEAYISLGTAYQLPITFISETENLARQTFEIAYKHNLSYYDASFLSLARQYDATLVTDNIKDQGKPDDIKVVPLKDY